MVLNKIITKKITLLSSRQTKNQQNKLQIRSKRLITKQSQIKTNKTTQIPKIFTFPSASFSLLFASLILSLILSTVASCLTQLLKQAFSASLILSLILCSFPLSTALGFEFSDTVRIRYNLFGHLAFSSFYWACFFYIELWLPPAWTFRVCLGLQVFFLFFLGYR